MTNDGKKLTEDLEILEQMAADMADYLRSDQLFWQKIDKKVEPTVGGFLERRHRLDQLKNSLLDASQRSRLEKVTTAFDDACSGARLRCTQKAAEELAARVRQWERMLGDLLADDDPSPAYYRADVEVRAIIQVLVDGPASVDSETSTKLATLDQKLRQRWQSGPFVWPNAWQPAYPQAKYWWLYGQISAE